VFDLKSSGVFTITSSKPTEITFSIKEAPKEDLLAKQDALPTKTNDVTDAEPIPVSSSELTSPSQTPFNAVVDLKSTEDSVARLRVNWGKLSLHVSRLPTSLCFFRPNMVGCCLRPSPFFFCVRLGVNLWALPSHKKHRVFVFPTVLSNNSCMMTRWA